MAREPTYITEEDMRNLIRTDIERCGNLRSVAEKCGVTVQQISRIKLHRESISARIAHIYGYKPVLMFEKIEGE